MPRPGSQTDPQPVLVPPSITPEEFVAKWRASTLKESASYAEHFIDLCHLLGQKTPAEADPHGNFFTFQKGVMKNAGGVTVLQDTLFGQVPVKEKTHQGFADVWLKGHFAWEYKGKHKDLEKAREQLLQYIDDLENPPLLVVCDFSTYEIHTRFNNCIKTVYAFTNDELLKPEKLALLRALFENVDFFKPTKTVNAVTEEIAGLFATLSDNLRVRGVEPHAAAHYLMKLLFCLFAEDTGLLPGQVFTKVVQKAVGRFSGLDADYEAAGDKLPLAKRKRSKEDEDFFVRNVRQLFRAMRKGGEFWGESIDYFNGGLFDDDAAHEMWGVDLETLYHCTKQDWSSIEPSIFGTLFERLLDPAKRSQLGAHYTSKEDIKTLVEPVLMQPLRRKWEKVQKESQKLLEKRTIAAGSKERAKADKELRRKLEDFCHSLSVVKVLDPACGSGNFLYVALNLLKEIEKEVVTLASKCGYSLFRFVSPQQLYGIEKNAYATELARLVVWIGHIQWDKNNGMYRTDTPILKPLENIVEMDAILTMPAKEGGVPTEPKWPECDVIVGNPPFLGGNRIRNELGDIYINSLFQHYNGRVSPLADLCCYWFERARQQIKGNNCKRAGLLATQGIRGGANREVLKRIKDSGDIFFAISDRDWILNGANVHISILGFDNGQEKVRFLDGKEVAEINSNLSSTVDITDANRLTSNVKLCLRATEKGGNFVLADGEARKVMFGLNPKGNPNSEVVRPWVNGELVLKSRSFNWIVDLYGKNIEQDASVYEAPFELLKSRVKQERQNNRDPRLSKLWWLFRRSGEDMRTAVANFSRYIATPVVAKHRIFVFLKTLVLPDHQLYIFARDDDYFFGVLHSRLHEVWTRAQGTQVRERESGFRYTPTTCFETFPLPKPTKAQEKAIAQAAKELDDLRNGWLNPPEWTREEVLTFPGSVDGPWARYVKNPDKRGIGTVHYPRIVPQDAECAAKLAKRTLTNLYNQRPTWLDLAHQKLDEAVCTAYGFPGGLSDEQILERLLKLNFERAKADADSQ